MVIIYFLSLNQALVLTKLVKSMALLKREFPFSETAVILS